MAQKDRPPFYQQVADKLIEQLKDGTAPWLRPWNPGEHRLPHNPVSGSRYKGANAVWLSSVAVDKGYSDPRWMTYKQAASAGAQVNKGEKGTLVQYWKFRDQVPKLDDQGAPVLDAQGKPVKVSVELQRPKVFSAVVFNAQQIAGLPALEPKTVNWDPHARAEAILAASDVPMHHDQADRAFYRPKTDEIHMPGRDQFDTADRYYATALHELGHATGHASRLDRDLSNPFGSEGYAKEELRAEIASMMLGDELGIGHDPGQHVAYVASWISVLQEDPSEILRASRDAEKIMEYTLGLERGQEQSLSVAVPQLTAEERLEKESLEAELIRIEVADGFYPVKEDPEWYERRDRLEELNAKVRGEPNIIEEKLYLAVPYEESVAVFRDAGELPKEWRNGPRMSTRGFADSAVDFDESKDLFYAKPGADLSRLTKYMLSGVEADYVNLRAQRDLYSDSLDVYWEGYPNEPGVWSAKTANEVYDEHYAPDQIRLDEVNEEIRKLEDALSPELAAARARGDELIEMIAAKERSPLGDELQQDRDATSDDARETELAAERAELKDLSVKIFDLTLEVNKKMDELVENARTTLATSQPERALSSSKELDAALPEKTGRKEANMGMKATGIAAEKTYLAVPYSDKDEVKKMGGKLASGRGAVAWDKTAKSWYARPGADLSKLGKWLTDGPKVAVATEVDPRPEFAEALLAAGLTLKGAPVMDGKMHRVQAEGDKGPERSGAYVGYLDGRPAGFIQNHRTGLKENWKSQNAGAQLSPEDKAALQADAAQKREAREAAREKQYEHHGRRCAQLYGLLPDAKDDHPYLVKKGIPAFPGMKVDKKGRLVVPLRDEKGKIASLQRITANGFKSLKKFAQKVGNYFVVGDERQLGRNGDPVITAEGVATAGSLALATGKPVVVAFDSGNLPVVAEKMAERYANSVQVIAGDDDRQKSADKNVGRIKAVAAAEMTKGVTAFPVFTRDGGTDWNDLHKEHGIGAVRLQMDAVLSNLERARLNLRQAAPKQAVKVEPRTQKFEKRVGISL